MKLDIIKVLMAPANKWFVYILECGNGSFYTGITTDLERRLKEHKSGRGARYTAYNRPVKLVYSEKAGSRSKALRREAAIKKLTRTLKLALIRPSSRRKPSRGRS